MKHTIAILLSIACLSTVCLANASDNVAGYRFDKYPAKIYTGKKAPLKLGQWKHYRTRLTEAYRNGTVNFAGGYIVDIFGCGAGCLGGAMIDKRTGKVYDTPLVDEPSIDWGCSFEFKNPLESERVVFFPNSRLFVSRSCSSEEVTEGRSREYHTFLIYTWNEKTKSFQKIKTVNKTIDVTY